MASCRNAAALVTEVSCWNRYEVVLEKQAEAILDGQLSRPEYNPQNLYKTGSGSIRQSPDPYKTESGSIRLQFTIPVPGSQRKVGGCMGMPVINLVYHPQ